MRSGYTALLALFFALAMSSAHADTIQYTIAPSSGNSTVFTIDSTKYTVASQYDEYTTSAGQSFFLGNIKSGGGFALQNGNVILLDLVGPVLFTGSLSTPTLLTGSFSLQNALNTSSLYTVTIADQSNVATAPEPSSMLLLGTGVLALLGSGRRMMRR